MKIKVKGNQIEESESGQNSDNDGFYTARL